MSANRPVQTAGGKRCLFDDLRADARPPAGGGSLGQAEIQHHRHGRPGRIRADSLAGRRLRRPRRARMKPMATSFLIDSRIGILQDRRRFADLVQQRRQADPPCLANKSEAIAGTAGALEAYEAGAWRTDSRCPRSMAKAWTICMSPWSSWAEQSGGKSNPMT